ncbi:hypothetical protein CCR97_28080 [Rhodoplanes elegans]|uniref:Uncharacterized protein n=1 Tax=Rhodoplanes elegans TaxID=29408 RepID=A0A327K7Y7_9BRAD|nr:hypothetical protein [Rhodoplanes elegans]RAI34391.1 hypothetical protein CH338_20935 [Rhodoplanes elegans]
MPALVAGIHVFAVSAREIVDGRDEPGHEGAGTAGGRRSLRREARQLSSTACAIDARAVLVFVGSTA